MAKKGIMTPLLRRSVRAFTFLAVALALGLIAPVASAAVTIPAAAQPQLAVTTEGRVFLTYGQGKDVFVVRSDDGGITFTPPVKVATAPALMLGMRRGPRIAAQGDIVTVTLPTKNLLAYASADGGLTWTGPTTINDVPESAREGLHDLAVSPNGRMFATWLDLRLGAMALFAAESADGGSTWTRNETLYRSPEVSICECCHPTALYDTAGNLAVMWRNWLGGSRDLWLMTRTAGSKPFSAPIKQGNGTWKLNGCPMDGGDIVTRPEGGFDTVWQREGGIFFQSGAAPELRISTGRQPVATRLGSGTLVVWQKGTDLWSAQLSANRVAEPPALLASGARFAVMVALPKGGALLAYEHGADIVVEQHE
jgi:hypothetical protein